MKFTTDNRNHVALNSYGLSGYNQKFAELGLT